jgi:Uma2 family endonuclease
VITAFPDRFLRVSYDRGTFEIMNIGIRHGRGQSFLSRLVTTLAVELNVELDGVGNMTCLRADLDKGIEPDDFWYVGDNAIAMRGREEIDLNVDPPPDLAVEMEVSRTILDRVGILAALRVPEVWRSDGETVRFLILQENDAYAEQQESRIFPGLNSADLTVFLARWKVAGANTSIREFGAWIRQRFPRP